MVSTMAIYSIHILLLEWFHSLMLYTTQTWNGFVKQHRSQQWTYCGMFTSKFSSNRIVVNNVNTEECLRVSCYSLLHIKNEKVRME